MEGGGVPIFLYGGLHTNEKFNGFRPVPARLIDGGD